jgi:hypothetical protein
MLEEIEFHRLAKLRLEVDEPDELYVLPVVFHTLSYTNVTGIPMAGYLPTRSRTTASRPRRNAPFSLWIVSSITQLLRTIP